MNMTGNTILITGGGSGIGRGLAEAFHKLGNQVVIAGRRKEMLEEAIAANPGMRAEVLDLDSAEAVREFASRVVKNNAGLNAVIHNAGIMRNEKLMEGQTEDSEAIVLTNLLGPIRLTAALLPALLAQPKATIMTVTSGLAFVPLAMTPTYCATKAAIHSYTQSLRYQLKDTQVQVVELAPPYVQTELMGPAQASDPAAMPLAEFIAESMKMLKASPEATEICVERVRVLRDAESRGDYNAFFQQFNDTMTASRASRQ